MIRQLAQCPYCQGCEIALDDSPQLVFNPGSANPNPCPHLAWVEARYSQWDRSPQGVSRVIGSADCSWGHPGLAAASFEGHLGEYQRELVNAPKGWEFAPRSAFELVRFSRDEKKKDAKGHEYPLWELDGVAGFAKDLAAFLAELPGCQQRRLDGLKPEAEEGPA